jgi:hypothetical protein
MNDAHQGDGVYQLRCSAAAKREDKGIQFCLRGDLCQMWTQEQFLLSKGMAVGRLNAYPGFKTQEEKQKAIALIWESRIEGWWNYEKELVEAGICTQERFDGALGRGRH